MDPILFFTQALNGLQFGVMLFLMATGLTLIFGVMNLINLAHGSLYMMGAYFAATLQQKTGSFIWAIILSIPLTVLLGMIVEMLALRRLYNRDHLDQVLATYGLILFFNELVRMVWGPQSYFMALPQFLSHHVQIFSGLTYPVYRLVIIGVGLGVGAGLYGLIHHTRLGMLIRAGASNREMVNALGVNIRFLYTVVFGLGAALAGLAGMLAGPILSVEVGMGEPILILAFVVIVSGGIGSIQGAFFAAVLVGVADTFGRVLLPPGMASMGIYVLMAAVLCWRPEGLFPAQRT